MRIHGRIYVVPRPHRFCVSTFGAVCGNRHKRLRRFSFSIFSFHQTITTSTVDLHNQRKYRNVSRKISLSLWRLNLTGTIPSSLPQLPNLNALHLDRNKLTGHIPKSLRRFIDNVPDLYLSHNQLSGNIPTSFAQMNFTSIDLSRNKLEWDALVIFGLNETTQIMDLSRNLLEFDLSKVEFPTSLASLDINHNKIYGSIPAKFTKLNFQFLNVSYSRLCGQTSGGRKLQSFDEYSYFHNRCLCGAPLPSCN